MGVLFFLFLSNILGIVGFYISYHLMYKDLNEFLEMYMNLDLPDQDEETRRQFTKKLSIEYILKGAWSSIQAFGFSYLSTVATWPKLVVFFADDSLWAFWIEVLLSFLGYMFILQGNLKILPILRVIFKQ